MSTHTQVAERSRTGRRLALLVAFAAGCSNSSNNATTVEARYGLTSEQARILGFEAPATDWTAWRPISASTTASQGSSSLAITPNGYVEILSAPLASVGPVKPQISVDVRIPEPLSWGEARVIVSIPSANMYWQDLGGVGLSGLAPQTFNKLTFALPAAVKTALEGSYSDLRLRIVLNTPNTSSPLLLDNLDIGNAGDGLPPDTTLNLTYPKGQSLSSVFLSASNRLQVDDRVTLAQAGEGALLAGLGSEGVEVGAGARVYGNLYGGGSVLLRSSSHVYGSVAAAGAVTKQQADVAIDGTTVQNTPVPTATLTMNVMFPDAGPGQSWPGRPRRIARPGRLRWPRRAVTGPRKSCARQLLLRYVQH